FEISKEQPYEAMRDFHFAALQLKEGTPAGKELSDEVRNYWAAASRWDDNSIRVDTRYREHPIEVETEVFKDVSPEVIEANLKKASRPLSRKNSLDVAGWADATWKQCKAGLC